MSARGRDLFDSYVNKSLNHPDLRRFNATSHAFNLSAQAAAEHISISQVIEEVGPITPALVARMRKR